jgi:Predicted membrane protein (DUF2238)
MKEYQHLALWVVTAGYLFWGGVYFIQDFNLEFVIYVGVIVAILGTVFSTVSYTKFPLWQLWLLSLWGLLHVLGGAVQTLDGVLFAYKVYPLLDLGGDFYILKYDQIVHMYLYGVVALMAYHLFTTKWRDAKGWLVALAAVLTSLGVSSLNEIMEFLIAVTIERNGVGGYENAMLDLIFNLSGAIIAIGVYMLLLKITAKNKT